MGCIEVGKKVLKGSMYIALFNSERSTDVLDSCPKCLWVYIASVFCCAILFVSYKPFCFPFCLVYKFYSRMTTLIKECLGSL